MDKAFNPARAEARWRRRWEELQVGRADAATDRPTFTIALPPPNITGVLHLGHACGFSIQDTLSRYHRMLGDEVEWCPGTDHAAIATQNVIERQLAEEHTSKEELGRERFQQRVDAWYQEYGGRIYEQMRRLGFTCDWSRARFTLDVEYVRAIRFAFKSLFDKGLIYRGPRIVNWCPRCRSAISDEEVEWQEHSDQMVTLKYLVEGHAPIEVATVRPETMLGDTAVAVSPGDPRYRDLVGKTAVLPLTHRRVPIIEDSAVRPEMGTGALKVTPGHDPADYEIGRRHSLPIITVISPDGNIDFPQLPQFHGMPVDKARVAITEALRANGAVAKVEDYVHEVGHCDRCGSVLEPLVSEQWWVRMKGLAQPAIAAVERGEVRFQPAHYTDVYLSWMNEIRDWCISRQLWLGHAIPVSTCSNGHRFAWIDPPESCPTCGDGRLTPDPDVLDTWFSSALWPFAIFGWPEQTQDLQRFYPTDVLVTAREIIFLWVARMIMAGLEFRDHVPFHDVIITSTIQAADGSRMSKSKGNVVDPLDMIERYGADAVRAWAAAVGSSGQDVRFDEDKILAYQRFANKLWSATRFLVMRLGDGEVMPAPEEIEPDSLLPEDRWVLARLADTARACEAALAAFRFHHAIDGLYDFFWHTYCDWYLEMVKPRLADDAPRRSREAASRTLLLALDVQLRLLHPFVPFVTEECAQRMEGAAPTLQHRPWPSGLERWSADLDGREGVDEVVEVVQQVRAVGQQHGIPAASKERQPLVLRRASPRLARDDLRRLLETLAPVTVTEQVANGSEPVVIVAGPIEAALHVRTAVGDASEARLRARLAALEQQEARLKGRLENPSFREKAPAEVVEQAGRALHDVQEEMATLRRHLGEEDASR